jgi:hypothetical protein
MRRPTLRPELLIAACVCLVVGIGFACGGGVERPPMRFQNHSFALISRATKHLGEDCSFGGNSDCLSGTCVKIGPHKDSDYICSANCADGGTAVCPGGWSCVQYYPADDAFLCAPEAGWVPHPASDAG